MVKITIKTDYRCGYFPLVLHPKSLLRAMR